VLVVFDLYKQVGLLNVEGYFNGLLEVFDKGVEDGFIDKSARHIMLIGDTPEELINKMEVISVVWRLLE